jgi:hypothetical protein
MGANLIIWKIASQGGISSIIDAPWWPFTRDVWSLCMGFAWISGPFSMALVTYEVAAAISRHDYASFTVLVGRVCWAVLWGLAVTALGVHGRGEELL